MLRTSKPMNNDVRDLSKKLQITRKEHIHVPFNWPDGVVSYYVELIKVKCINISHILNYELLQD